MIPLFSSNYSIGRGILTLEEPAEIKDNSPVSIFSICKTHNIQDIYLADSNFCGFLKFYEGCKKYNFNPRYGIKMYICADINDKSEASFSSESKVIIFIKNSAGYSDLCKIYSKAYADGFYYIPRIDWNILNKMWTDNLLLVIPFYDGFLHVNLLKNGNCIPKFPVEPTFCLENHKLPFDNLLNNSIIEYTKQNNYPMLKSHQIYYYKNEDANTFQVFRIITGRNDYGSASIEEPRLDHFSSKYFSFESFLELNK